LCSFPLRNFLWSFLLPFLWSDASILFF
jgi:hypothetical protein